MTILKKHRMNVYVGYIQHDLRRRQIKGLWQVEQSVNSLQRDELCCEPRDG